MGLYFQKTKVYRYKRKLFMTQPKITADMSSVNKLINDLLIDHQNENIPIIT